MKILFFGASVTAQKTGYVPAFCNLLKQNGINDFLIDKKGYGGMHVKDAGIFYAGKLSEKNYDVVFLDWFSTGYAASKPADIVNYFDAIVYSFLSKNTHVVFLILPRLEWDRSYFDHCKSVVEQRYALPILDISSRIAAVDWSVCLRDKIHTNEEGSKRYADCVYNFLRDVSFGQTLEIKTKECIDAYRNKYNDISSVVLAAKKTEKLTLCGECELVGLSHTIGPYTHAVDVYKNNNLMCEMWFWDQWCYYERETMHNVNISIDFGEEWTIQINETALIDKSVSKIEKDWNREKKYLLLNEIFYIGVAPQILCDSL